MKVFTPYHRAWLAEVKASPSLIGIVSPPSKNSAEAKKELTPFVDSRPPTPPKEKQFASNEERDRIRKLWPAGHQAAFDRLTHFLDDKMAEYAATRSNPAKDSTSRLSAYLSAGVLSVREVLTEVAKRKASTIRPTFPRMAAIPAWPAGCASWSSANCIGRPRCRRRTRQ